ncbi:MAG: GTPase ObgE [Candidatus Eisenbacteria sp.]|nr:GTPase ObgE [Candidatus Eisenbacteria bacterium]
MFVDECVIMVSAGAGGNGCVSFRREKYVPRGGPDGGDGGAGGHVYLCVNPHLRTLYHLRHTPAFRAAAGGQGKGKQMTGANGEDAIVSVPPGTTVCDATTGELLADAVTAGERILLAGGGRGGRGNTRFRSSVRRTPRIAEKGTAGEERRLKLTLKLMADVGLVGLPNAGKSTLLARLSNAKPRIAGYPFTTLAPMLGIVPVGEEETLVFADLPGLIEGAHAGRGLGQRFLRHIERTRLLLFLIEATDPDPAHTLKLLRRELIMWSPALGERESLVCLSKADLLGSADQGELPALAGRQPHWISAHTGQGLPALLRELAERVRVMATETADVGGAAGGGEEEPEDAKVLGRPRPVGPDPWPTAWVVPDRKGVCLASAHERRPAGD